MKKIIILSAMMACMVFTADAQDNLRLRKNGDLMTVSMDLDLESLDVKDRRSVHLIPVLKNGRDSLELTPVGVYSRGRYINYLRNGESVFEDMGEEVYKESKAPEVLEYSVNVKYDDWMDGSQIYLLEKTCGCCSNLKAQKSTLLGEFRIPTFDPYFIYIQPEAEKEKNRELAGSAYIDFIVSRTDIRPEYRNNREEINKILATIDSVRKDDDVTVKRIYFKGYASPESPYANNERLAKGRTESLKSYVMNQYKFDNEDIETDYEPENWEGLRAFVETSKLQHKQEILEVIDGNRDPDTKEWIIKSRWKADYRHLLDFCYPALRKTDYRIEYNIKVYTDVDEIVEVFHTSPNKLSLNELYLASTAFDSQSEEYRNVFETAVKMYPDDPVSNLNAANVAMADGNYRVARNYLNKAGDSPEVKYAWGLYYIGVGSYDKAEDYLNQAREEGVAEAREMLGECAEMKEYYENN